MAVQVARAPGADPIRGAIVSSERPLPPGDGRKEGLGFVSTDYGDLFRKLTGELANKDPIALKPIARVKRASDEELQVPHYPMGILCVKLRMPGDRHPADAVVKGEYMKWAVRESLAETITRIGRVRLRPEQVLFCMDEIEILDLQTPFLGQHVWQFCQFRIDFKVALKTAAEAATAASNIFTRMVDAEAELCKNLETKFRNIYNLTVLGLINKRFLLMNGQQLSDELALFRAAQANDLPTMSALFLQGTDVDASQQMISFPGALLDEDLRFLYLTLGRTPLLGAAEEGHVDAMARLLQAGADIHFQDTSGFHALYLAAGAPEADDAVRLLLAEGAELNLASTSGYTPLHNSCGSGEVGAMRLLLAARADLNFKSRNGAAPVHVAVVNSQLEILRALKDLSANLDMPAFGGNTPVHEAVMQNSPEVIRELFSLRADINVESGPDNGFATPLKMAMERKRRKAQRCLQELGALEHIEHEYEDSSEGEFQAIGDGEFVVRVKGRLWR